MLCVGRSTRGMSVSVCIAGDVLRGWPGPFSGAGGGGVDVRLDLISEGFLLVGGEDALVCERIAKAVDRITRFPGVQLPGRAVLCGVAPRVAAVAVGLALDQAGAIAAAGALDG